ncbi:hypothetical protein U1E44_05185 [Arenibacter sp. GZD96]|nr:hypothetical protein [Arenibacter sp. GZD-96]MEA1785475.1 hypothetical protein [Arenibacter sp. GZD-96]
MAVMLLASTTYWMVDKHYCMGHLMDMAFFKNAVPCDMAMQMDHEADHGIQEVSSCCSDELIVVDGQDHLKQAFNDISASQHLFLVAYTYAYLDFLEGTIRQPIPHEHYPPPLLIKDRLILDQVFRI